MFKALLAASIAMLACCAAAALAGPVAPISELPPRAPHPLTPGPAVSSLDVIDALPPAASASHVVGYDPANDFMPVPLTTGSAAPVTTSPPIDDEAVLPAPQAEPAVIPLPTPLYAALALLAIAIFARRTVIRAC